MGDPSTAGQKAWHRRGIIHTIATRAYVPSFELAPPGPLSSRQVLPSPPSSSNWLPLPRLPPTSVSPLLGTKGGSNTCLRETELGEPICNLDDWRERLTLCILCPGTLLTLSHMAYKVLFTIWQGGQLAIPLKTTLAKVKTILGAELEFLKSLWGLGTEEE
jgi:hypothetical protein